MFRAITALDQACTESQRRTASADKRNGPQGLSLRAAEDSGQSVIGRVGHQALTCEYGMQPKRTSERGMT